MLTFGLNMFTDRLHIAIKLNPANDYLHLVRIRRRYNRRNIQPNIEVGDVVLLKDKNILRNDWVMCVIVNIIPRIASNALKYSLIGLRVPSQR